MAQKQWRIVGDYGVEKYQCGLSQGQKVRVIKTIEMMTHTGEPAGKKYDQGEIWTVLSGSASDPGVVWLLKPNGDRHTWDDDESIYEHFEVLSDQEGEQVT